MRVTKRIEEYILRTLHNKAQSKIDEIWAPSREERDNIEEQFLAIMANAEAKAQELLAQYPQYTVKARYSNPEGNIFTYNETLSFKPGYDRELVEETDRIRKASKEAGESIILELELGGDKAMLEKLLNEVVF